MRHRTFILAIVLLGVASFAHGQAVQRDPHIGYLYPAGGQRGTTVRVLVGGQFLRGMDQVHVSGEGAQAKVLTYYYAMRNLDGDQRQELQRRMSDCAKARWAELVKAGKVQGTVPGWLAQRTRPRDREAEPVKIPEHYLLTGWERLSLRELAYVRYRLTDRRKQQANAQIAESVLVEVTIDPDAAPGDRELRLLGRSGLTNPMVFQVGQMPEVNETEFNDPGALPQLPREEPCTLPIVINGQILPGDVDRIRFSARKGQSLVVLVQARHLVPFLADAVPGWFQAIVCVYDAEGNELAFADDYHFDPDPVMRFVPPADGEYELEIRDSIYRGREDFVYRVSIGEFPFITSIFPAGGREGHAVAARITGWNLPSSTLELPASPVGLHHTALAHPVRPSNRVLYSVDTLEETFEREPNDTTATSHVITRPVTINGRIASDSDLDIYRIVGSVDQPIVARITARQLRSPLDAILKLTDVDGNIIAINDDAVDKQGHLHRGMGVLTHFADPSLLVNLPRDGTYYLHVSDVTGHGGAASSYRLYVGPPRPDFDLYVAPSSLSMVAGTCTPITVHAVRRDGFDGPIELQLGSEAKGFVLSGGAIPAGRDLVRLTVTAPPRGLAQPVALTMTGSARTGDRAVNRRASPADDVMQAFLWRHLVPAEQWLAVVRGSRRMSSSLKRIGDDVMAIPLGGSATVHISIPAQFRGLSDIQLRPVDPPSGISTASVHRKDDQLSFDIVAATDATEVRDNLIVEVSAVFTWKPRDGKERSQRRTIGYLPAIPFHTVK